MPDGLNRGWYVRPTIFADVDNRMRIEQEEILSPVLSVIQFDDAVQIANDSEYGPPAPCGPGLRRRPSTSAAGSRTGIVRREHRHGDLDAPFGQTSGIGRGFGPDCLAHYTEVKSIYTPQQEGLHFSRPRTCWSSLVRDRTMSQCDCSS